MASVRKNFRIDSVLVDLMEKAVSKGTYENQTELVEKAIKDLINKELSKEEIHEVMEQSIKKQIEDRLADSQPVGSSQGEPVIEEKTFIYEIDEQQKKEIKRLYDEGCSIKEILNITGVAHKVIRNYLSVHYGERFFCVKCDKFEGTIHVREKKGGESPFCIDCGTYAF